MRYNIPIFVPINVFNQSKLFFIMRKLYLNLALSAMFLGAGRLPAENWMGRLPDNAYVATLSIPGTHDTATGHGFTGAFDETFSRCQDLTFEEQWDLGIRAFDFRPKVKDGYLNANHGSSATNLRFDDAMHQLRDWLQASPTEFAVVHLLYAVGYDKDKEEYASLLADLMLADDMKDCLVEFRRDLTVGDVRGKILLLSRDEYADQPVAGGFFQNWCGWLDWNAQTSCSIKGFGGGEISNSALYVQDLANTKDEADGIAAKVRGITKMLDYSTTHFTADPRQLVWIYNFSSSYDGFISTSDSYRENASTTNAAIIDYLTAEGYVPGPTGIVLMDYAGVAESKGYATRGDELVKVLIDNNFKYIGQPAGQAGGAVSFAKDADRDYTNKMGMGAKNSVPLMADFDANGLTDVFFGGETYIYDNTSGNWTFSDGSFLALGNGAGNVPAWDTHTDNGGTLFPVYYGGQGSRTVDIDQDGAVDYLLYDAANSGWTGVHPNKGYGRLRLIRNNGDGTGFTELTDACDFAALQLNLNGVHGNNGTPLHCIAVADVDLDGYPDLLFQSEGNNPWTRVTRLYMNRQGKGFEEAEGSRFIGANNGSVLFGDFNSDGYPDAVVTGYADADEEYGTVEGSRMDFYKNDGKGNFTLANTDIHDDVNYTSARWGQNGEECVMYVIDFDQDGKQDILIIGSTGGDGYGRPDTQENGKMALLLKNVSADGKFAFEEVPTGIFPTSANASRVSALADFNGDGFVDYVANGWGMSDGQGGYGWSNTAYCSYSTGLGQYELVRDVIAGEDGFMGYGDVDGDGMLDFMSPWNNDNGSPMFYRNTTLVGRNAMVEVPAAPTGLKTSYDAAAKRLMLIWDKMATATGSKAVYNAYIVKDGKTFMRCPAVKETGRQTAYTDFSVYLPSEVCFFEDVEPGEYEVGVQSVSYSWNASEFATCTVEVKDDGEGVTSVAKATDDAVDVYTLSGMRMKAGVSVSKALDGLRPGVYVVGGKRVLK